MDIIPQNYENLLKETIVKNFSSILSDNITRNDDKNRVFNYINLLSDLDEKLCEVAKKSLLAIFDAIDRGFKNSPERRHKYHIKSRQERTVLTMFGEITFKRTFYTSKYKSGSYCYLDDYLGLKKYDYFDPYIKATVLEYAANNSSGKVIKYINDLLENRIKIEKPFNYISKQTIRNIILNSTLSKPEMVELETPETIYIIADEKFIPTQNNDNNDVMLKSIVTFDGITNKNGRNSLNNKRVFADFKRGLIDDSLDYLYYTYNMDKIKNIFIMGDGAGWIKNLKHHFKVNKDTNVIFALDKFHFKQALHHICLNKDLEGILVSYVLGNYQHHFNECCELLIKSNPHREKVIKEKHNYILNNWNYIHNLYEYNLSCPMESQISHNIADLFTSRPKAYSLNTLAKLLGLRLLLRNNHNIKFLYLNNHNKKEQLIINQKVLKDSVFPYKEGVSKFLSSKAHYAYKHALYKL